MPPLILPVSRGPSIESDSLLAAATMCGAHTLAVDADFWQIFEEREHLGRGCFGTVLLVQPVQMPAECFLAAKVVSSDDATAALHEAAMLRSLDHANIVTLQDVYASPTTVFMTMAAELGGDLQQRVDRTPGGVLSEAEAAVPVAGVLAAIRYLHCRHGIVHRDVKASNVLLASDGSTAKLGDFGLAAPLPADGRLTSVCGTHDFLAPEMIRTAHGECCGYGCSVDMWAVGLMLHALLLGDNPFERETDTSTLLAILAGDYARPAGRLSAAACDLLCALLVPDPAKRASADDAAGLAWLASRSPKRRGSLLQRLWARAG